MTGLRACWRDERLNYDGRQLAPHYLLSHYRLEGSVIAAFRGSCRVETEHLVDWEDRLANDSIVAREMVHFLGEFFGWGLREGVLAQRLFMALAFEELHRLGVRDLRRDGDDLFVGARKLSVSIVTASPVSVLLHAGINIDPEGAPVAAVGLAELDVDPVIWAQALLRRFEEEVRTIGVACTKVRPVV